MNVQCIHVQCVASRCYDINNIDKVGYGYIIMLTIKSLIYSGSGQPIWGMGNLEASFIC